MNAYQQVTLIFQYILILVGILGIIGNILTFCVFSRKRLKKFSFSFYSRVMACSDIVVMAHSFRHWSAFVLKADIDLISSFFCTIDEYQPYVATFSSLWLLTLIALDRLITIVFPSRFKILKARWFQVTLVTLVITYSFLANILLPLNYRIVSLNDSITIFNSSRQFSALNERKCSISSEVSGRQSWIYLANILFLTLVINNIISAWMIFHIFFSRKKLTSVNNLQRNSAIKDRKFAMSSIGLNLCSLICKMPFSTGLLISNYVHLGSDLYDMIFIINVVVLNSENAATLLINLLVNSIFFKEFFKMLGIKKMHSKAFYN